MSHECSFSEAYDPIDKKIVPQTIKMETGLKTSGKRKSDIGCDETGKRLKLLENDVFSFNL